MTVPAEARIPSPAEDGAADGADALDGRRVLGARGLLRDFNVAGVLAPVDVHVAQALGRLTGCEDQAALLAAAFAVRAPRLGSVCAVLAELPSTVTVDDEAADLEALPWPEPGAWRAATAASPLVRAPGSDGVAPLVLDGGRLYLDRYHRYERRVATLLRRRAAAAAAGAPEDAVLRAALERLLPGAGDADPQRAAAATALRRCLTVVAGGPGTGKTTAVARIVALLCELPGRPLRIALAAPTGKAADRMRAAVAAAADDLQLEVDDAVRARMRGLEATTIHRLLGSRGPSSTRFRHDAARPLPVDVVIVDEASMVSLALMAKLLDAIRPDARVVLVGDPAQLASVEAGSVLGDVVGAAADPAGPDEPGASAPRGVVPAVVVLRRVHRFAEGGGIAALASAVQRGDAGAAVAALRDRPDLVWIETEAGVDQLDGDAVAPVRDALRAVGAQVLDAARQGRAADALAALDRVRLLCAHRRGPSGLEAWTETIERWLAAGGTAVHERNYVGRPVVVRRNDRALGLFNGDTGVVVQDPASGERRVAFSPHPLRGEPRLIGPQRLDAVDTAHVLTVHLSQGSQFDRVVLALPDARSPLLTRELLYTAVTRARHHLVVVGSAAALTSGVERRLSRSSGLGAALAAPSPRDRRD